MFRVSNRARSRRVSTPCWTPSHEDWIAAAAALARLEGTGSRNFDGFHRLQRELDVRIAAPFLA
jgi:hypothetical protein